ncbi:hypothetical protein P4O66_008997, partial [Electrophorus voltai]
TLGSEKERNLGPGTYNPDFGGFSARAVQEQAKRPDWKRAQEIARLPRHAWENEQFLKSKVGPGTYRITSFTEELEKKPGSVRGVCETREERFKDCQSGTPGPGTYGKGGIPSAALEEKERRSMGTCFSMGSNPSLQRFPSGIVDSGLSPGTYSLKSSTDLILSRRVSKRGPYDLFTGPRDSPISCGYFAVPRRVNLDPGEYTKEMPKFGENLQRPEKKRHGVFSKMEQYPTVPTERLLLCSLAHCPQPATFPGPGWYDVTTTIQTGQSRSAKTAPFLTSAPRSTVGPGRYDITSTFQSQSGSGHRSLFESGSQRFPFPARDKYRRERLRPINVPVDRSSLLQSHSTFNGGQPNSSAKSTLIG